MSELLDIVNEHDEVVGQVERGRATDEGMTCRVVYLWLYTPAGEVILQRRSLLKKSMPGRLTTTVSGHVESGSNYFDTVLKETEEETGVHLDSKKLIDLGKRYYDSGHGMRWAGRFIYKYEGDLGDLKVEEGEGDGFELMKIAELRQMIAREPARFTPLVVGEHGRAMLDAIEAHVK